MTRMLVVPILVAAVLVARPLVRADDEWTWPEKPKNLQVLPKDFTGRRLSPLMRGFTRALGVRCSYCHVGEEGKPLGTYDFASDKNPNKGRAREMYKMLGSIGDQLEKIEPSGDKRVNMWCHTCHQGRPRPMVLEEDLGEAYRRSGVAGAVGRYRELRERYYGRGGYDFAEGSLNEFADELLEKGDKDAAIAVLRLNASQFPQSATVWNALGAAYAAAGQNVPAEIYYRKSLEIDPENAGTLEKLRELMEKP